MFLPGHTNGPFVLALQGPQKRALLTHGLALRESRRGASLRPLGLAGDFAQSRDFPLRDARLKVLPITFTSTPQGTREKEGQGENGNGN